VEAMSRTLIIIGLVIIAIGLAWPWLARLGAWAVAGRHRYRARQFLFLCSNRNRAHRQRGAVAHSLAAQPIAREASRAHLVARILENCPDDTPDVSDLVLVDSVAHAWIDALGNVGTEPLQDFGGLSDAFERDMRIAVAAADEDRCAGERARIVLRRHGFSDQAAGQSKHGAKAAGMPRRKFERQARPLREAEKGDPFRRDSSSVPDFGDKPGDDV
jgi:hypothetical protein